MSTKPNPQEVLVVVPVSFTRLDIQQLLDAANFSDKESLQVDDLLKDEARWAAFVQVLSDTDFSSEIIDGSDEACANGWLDEFGVEEDEDE